MTRIGPPVYSRRPEIPHETFCTYLAKQFIATKGFEVARVPETKRLYEVCDVVLTRSDGYTFGILCMVDREVRPNATFPLSVEELEAIGESCLKYSGKIRGRTMPIFIQVVEVGPTSPDQAQRLRSIERSSLFAKVLPSAMIVDPVAGEVWNGGGAWFSKGLHHSFVKQLLAAPRETDLDFTPPTVLAASPSFPFLTVAIILALAAVFAAEIVFGIGAPTKALQPSNVTLVAFGGMMKNLVLQSGQWYRLLSAPFLHLDITHLVMNAAALFIAGRSLESLIGRAWFGAVYVASALTGSLLSLALNSPLVISVGASGAIMGLFAAMLVISLHFPAGPLRTGLQINAAYVLIPSLLPLVGALKGQKVDYAAHFGGAIGGAVIGAVLLTIWSRTEVLPAFRRVAATIAVAGVLVLAYPVMSLLQGHQSTAFAAQLIPANKLPKTGAEMRLHATELIAQYPHDPRPRLVRAGDLLDANDLSGAEREARAGLADENSWRPLFPPQFSNSLRAVLALAINKDRREEALQTARPACDVFKDGPMRKLLDDRKLCGT